jgi:hypothetical protein
MSDCPAHRPTLTTGCPHHNLLHYARQTPDRERLPLLPRPGALSQETSGNSHYCTTRPAVLPRCSRDTQRPPFGRCVHADPVPRAHGGQA